MKFTLSWLKRHLDTQATVDEIAIALTRVGLEVESVENPTEALKDFVVAEVRDAQQHPNADRLKVCKVWDGKKELNIVCGAPNARAGIKVVLANVGVVIPVSGEPLKLGKIRGEESQGMLCSYEELKIDGDSAGIIELPADAAVGSPAVDALGAGDPIFEIGLTPNRADCAGIRGIARDLAAAGIGTLKPLPEIRISENGKSHIGIKREVDDKLCPLFATRLIMGVKNGPSPEWLQQQLRAVGLRPISALVDITNFFTMDRARPLHVFDADKIKGALIVRDAHKGEKLDALNDKSYELAPGMVVIADDNGVQSLAGVVGGVATSCDENTVNVLLEAALWDAANIARTGRDLQINSDARYRFERGVDPKAVISGLDAAAQMIVELCGGQVSAAVIAGAEPDNARNYTLRTDRCKTLGGIDLSIAQQSKILMDLGFIVVAKDGALQVTTPSWRHDVMGEADLVEEILRIHGFDNIPPVSVPMADTVPAPGVNDNQRRVLRARRALAAQGLLESVTWSFVKESEAKVFGGGADNLKLVNPISTDMSDMRPTPLPGLLAALQNNFNRGIRLDGLFEIGPAFLSPAPDGQQTRAAWVRSPAPQRHWQGNQSADVMTVKADVVAILNALGQNTDLPVTRDVPGYYHPGRAGAIYVGKNPIAYFGELHPEVCGLYDFKTAPVVAEIILDNLPPPTKKGNAKPLLDASVLQPVSRD
ncbi:MAG TPA: phenylalanine--tRNA ligase subunit beta, partial [Alphaproteobacteria bacterium]|nr:phenylalanine--tRNA ligase subunit beta [Alphaproteobacteria bacterium]